MLVISDIARVLKEDTNTEYRRVLTRMIKLLSSYLNTELKYSNHKLNIIFKLNKKNYEDILDQIKDKDMELEFFYGYYGTISSIAKITSELVDSIFHEQTKLMEKVNLDIAFCRYTNTDATEYLNTKRLCNEKLLSTASALRGIKYSLEDTKNNRNCLVLLNSINTCLDVIFENEEIAHSYM